MSMPEEMSEMPDLTACLREQGLYREYVGYVQQCRKHRLRLNHVLSLQPRPSERASLGDSVDTRGSRRAGPRHSLSLSFTNRGESNPAHFEEYYPTHRKFMWHHTASYWTAILFVQGSLLFTFSSSIEVFEESLGWSEETVEMLTLWPNIIGSLMFSMGAYCSYLNLINMKKEPDEPIEYFWTNWQRVRENNSEVTSRVGTMAYLHGANFFFVGSISPLFHLTGVSKFILVDVPAVVGGACFVLGGFCEIVHNGVRCPCHPAEDEAEEIVGHRSTYRDPAWWIAIFNTVGGINYVLAALPGFFELHSEPVKIFGQVNMFVGSGIFVATSWLLVVMWKSNDFGLALLRQLNDAIGTGAAVARGRRQDDTHVVQIELQRQVSVSSDEHQKTMSIRGAVFIGIYSWLSFMAIINVLCLLLWDRHTVPGKEHVLRDISEASTQILLILGVMLVLGMHSTVTSVPKEEPYRFLVMASRLVLTFGAVGQTISFLDFIRVPYDDKLQQAIAVA